MAGLDPERGERGMVDGRRTSTPVSRRAPVDLDALVLQDPRSGTLAVLREWGARIRWEQRIAGGKVRTMGMEASLIAEHWEWAVRQPWGPQMVAQLGALADRLYEVRHGVKLRACPVCGGLVRLDRIVSEHRDCIARSA